MLTVTLQAMATAFQHIAPSDDVLNFFLRRSGAQPAAAGQRFIWLNGALEVLGTRPRLHPRSRQTRPVRSDRELWWHNIRTLAMLCGQLR